MLVKLDEDLSASLAKPLEGLGHTVATVHGQGWGGSKDPVLWPRVVAEGAYFITADKGFGDIRKYPPGTHPGIALLRPAEERLSAYRALLQKLLDTSSLDDLKGALAVVTERAIRIRRPPKLKP